MKLSHLLAVALPTVALSANLPHVVPTSKREAASCSKRGDRPQAIRILEHALPTAQQTHEVLYDPQTHSVLVTQMEEGRLVKLGIDKATGELTNPVESTRLDVPHRDKEGKPFIGLHGLALSEMFPGHAWATLQYVNTIVLIDIATLSVKASFPCPQTLADGETSIGGPHSVTEKLGHIYVTMKGGASCHGLPDEGSSVEEATAHGVWRVAIDEATSAPVDEGYVFMVAATPPMCAVDDKGDCWVVADGHPSVACIPFDATPSADDMTGSGARFGEPPIPDDDEELRAKVRPIFDAVDTDGSGACSVDEVAAISTQYDLGLSAEELARQLRETDTDGSGEVDFEEFVAALRTHSKRQDGGGLGGLFAMRTVFGLGAKSYWLPYQFAVECHSTGPGITIGPDGRPWFCILNGNGLIGTIGGDGKMKVIELCAASSLGEAHWNGQPRICHLQWGSETVGGGSRARQQPVLFCISSDLVDKAAVNTVIRVRFDASLSQVVAQHEIAMPTQATCCHRIALVAHPTHESLLVTELTKSQLLQVFTETLPSLSRFPKKQMTLTSHRVYDALADCPRVGTPTCMCEGDSFGGAVPVEDPWDMPNLHQFTKALGMKPDYVDPRTGELKFKAPGSWEALPSSAFSDYPIRGFDRKEVPATELYEENGATPPAPEEPTDRARRVGEGPAARTYRPGFIKQLLRREPWRRPSMTADMRATGLSDADLAEWEWDLAGRFADPDAPETPPCEISVANDATAVVIRGFDASGARTWTAHASLDPQSGVLVADFAPRGGREGFRGQVTTALPEAFSADKLPGIMWEDGSVWERLCD